MDAESAFSTDAIVFPLLIAAFIVLAVIRPLYCRNRRRGRDADRPRSQP
jgi:hypothetical protein